MPHHVIEFVVSWPSVRTHFGLRLVHIIITIGLFIKTHTLSVCMCARVCVCVEQMSRIDRRRVIHNKSIIMCNKLSKFVELLINFGATLREKHETKQLDQH